MKQYKVVVRIPSYVEKTIYVDDATSATDARRRVKNNIFGDSLDYDMSGEYKFGKIKTVKATVIMIKGQTALLDNGDTTSKYEEVAMSTLIDKGLITFSGSY